MKPFKSNINKIPINAIKGLQHVPTGVNPLLSNMKWKKLNEPLMLLFRTLDEDLRKESRHEQRNQSEMD